MAAGASDFLVLERVRELADDVGEKHGVGVAEKKNIAGGMLLQAVQHGGFSCVLGSLDEGDALVLVAFHDFSGLVGRAVVTNENFQFFFRVIQFQEVLDFAFNNRFFVVGGNQNGNGGDQSRIAFIC